MTKSLDQVFCFEYSGPYFLRVEPFIRYPGTLDCTAKTFPANGLSCAAILILLRNAQIIIVLPIAKWSDIRIIEKYKMGKHGDMTFWTPWRCIHIDNSQRVEEKNQFHFKIINSILALSRQKQAKLIESISSSHSGCFRK